MSNSSIKTGAHECDGNVNLLIEDYEGITGSIAIKASSDNADPLYLANTEDDLDNDSGFELGPGEGLSLDIVSARDLRIKGTSADKLSWITTGP